MQKWEYKAVNVFNNVSTLNELGSEGWRVVYVREIMDIKLGPMWAVLCERPVDL